MPESKNTIKININNTEISMIKCSSGSFIMGEHGPCFVEYDKYAPLHKVTISKDFFIGQYPITQAQYKAIIGNNPSYFKGKNKPVECVSWFEAKEFCQVLNNITTEIRPIGYKFDLPTEAQWEYACRAGTTSSYNNGKNIACNCNHCPNLDKLGWYIDNSDGKTHPVGLKRPNDWGIYDMHGNVCEWCNDWFAACSDVEVIDPEGPYFDSTCIRPRICRGEAFDHKPVMCRSSFRNLHYSATKCWWIGFRLALIPEK